MRIEDHDGRTLKNRAPISKLLSERDVAPAWALSSPCRRFPAVLSAPVGKPDDESGYRASYHSRMVVTDTPDDDFAQRWSGDVDVARWATGHGFGERTYSFDRDGLTQFKNEFPTDRCGLYLFECANHEVYIGIAKDVAQRLPYHLKKHQDVQIFRYLPHPGDEPERRKVERQLVRAAQRTGLIVRNREHASGHLGPSTLDALVTGNEQTAWLRDPVAVNAQDVSALIELDPSQLAAHDGDFRRLQQHPRYRNIVATLGVYAARCIPFPHRTEATFWTVSCFPSSNHARIFCVSMAALETFYIAVSDNDHDDIHAIMFVDNRHLPSGRWGRAILAARGVMFDDEYKHKSGGAFEQCLVIDDIRYLPSVLKIKHVRRAAAAFNLDLMRKRQSAYKPSHCRQLAAAALETAYA